MTEIQPYSFGAPLAAQSRGERSREWLELFFETAKAAEVLARTDFVPPSMKGKTEQVAATIMKGYELDIDPLDALANVYSVHGRIGFYAEFMRRRIIQSGHELKIVEANDTRAIVAGRRKGVEEWERAQFTAQQARNAKIDISAYAEDKLVARATSRLCKRVFPDVLSGAAIAEDLMDEQAAAPVPVPSERLDEPSEPGTIQRRRMPKRPVPASGQPPVTNTRPVSAVAEADEPPLPGADEEPTESQAEPEVES